MKRFLNLGCGSRFCSESCWTNVDFVAIEGHVAAHDLSKGVPFSDNTFDAVYHSNILEHFNRDDGARFIQECFRVLKKNGILRVVVPDLEGICRFYLNALEKIENGETEFQRRYDWILLEMYDQTVRTHSGGAMAQHLSQLDAKDRDFVISRIGTIGQQGQNEELNRPLIETPTSISVWKKIVRRIKHSPSTLRNYVKSQVLAEHEKAALSLGLFRLSGEIHQWMYDEFSLRKLLQSNGFENIRRCSAQQSQIENWDTYFLDANPDGFEHAPSALFMEATKPA